MNRLFLAGAALALAMSLGLSADAQDKKTLAFVVNGASDFWKAAEAGVAKAQEELPNYELVFKYPETATAAVQQRLMDDLVAAGVAGIMVSPNDPKHSTEALNRVADQAALFTTDSDAPDSKRIAYVGSSNVDAGVQAGELMKKAMPDGGKCIMFVGILANDNARERVEGIKTSIAGTKIEILDVREDDIEQYADAKGFPIIPCNLCGSQENLQRKQVKKMLAQWEKDSPGRVETMSRALGDIRPSQLSDPKLFDFLALGKRGDAAMPDAHAWLAGGETHRDDD